MTTPRDRPWELFIGRMRKFVSKRVSDPNDVEDILQEVFLKVHASLGTLRDRNHLSPWLYRIARNTIIDHYRTRRTYVPATDELPDEKMEDEESPSRRIAAGLTPMMARLPEKYKKALELFELEGLTLKEIAKKEGLSLAGAKSRVQRGRALLRSELLACCHFEFDRRKHLIDYIPRSPCCKNCKAANL